MEKVRSHDGEFSPMDAKEVLLNLISSKLQFQAINEFTSENFRQRLSELRLARGKITAYIEKARKEGSFLTIQSSITFSCIEGKKIDRI